MPTISNTNFLYFDCFGATVNNTNYLASILVPPTNPGLQVLGLNELAQAQRTLPSIELSPGINCNYSAFSQEEFYRTINVQINSLSLNEFTIDIGDEPDVEEFSLQVADANNPTNPYLSPLTNSNSIQIGHGNFLISVAGIPSNYISTTSGVRTITLAQRCLKLCSDPFNTQASLEIDCGNICGIINDFQIVGQPIVLKAIMEEVTDIDYISSELHLPNSSATPVSPCDGIYYYDISFNYNNDIASELNEIKIPINTQFFTIQEVLIGDGATFSSPMVMTPLPYPNISIINPAGNNSTLVIGVNAIFNISNPSWPGFNNTYNPASPNGQAYLPGPWINTNSSVTSTTTVDLVVRVVLSSNFPNQQNCPDLSVRLTPPTGQINLTLYNSCEDPTYKNFTPNTIAAPPATGLPSAPSFTYIGPGNPQTPGGPYYFISQISIPNQDPFQIDISSTGPSASVINTPIKCSTIVYRAFLSAFDLSPPSTNNNLGSISNLLVNGSSATITSISSNLISFDLPVPAGSTQPFTNFSIEFGVSGMPCPDPGSGQGQLRYDLKLVAICDDCAQPPSTPSNSIRNLFCLSTDVTVHCSGNCGQPVETYNDLVVERTTFGWANSADYNNGLAPLADATAFTNFCNNLNIPGQPPVITQNQIYDQLGRMYPHDLFKLSVTGLIQPAPYTHDNLSFEINYDPNTLVSTPPSTFLSLENYTLTFNPTSGGQPVQVVLPIPLAIVYVSGPPQPFATPQDRIRLTWDAGVLAGLNVYINSMSYNLALEATFRINATTPGGNYPYDLQCLFITESNNGTTINEYRSCDQRGRTITLIIPEVILRQNTKQTGNINLPANPPNSMVGIGNDPERFCDFVHAIGICHAGGCGNLTDFFPEYRPLTSWPGVLPGTNISDVAVNPVSGFPVTQNYTLNGGGNYENASSTKLLPTLARGEINSAYQGLVLTMEKDCPNSNPAVDLNLDINQNAYIHSGHYFGNWSPPNPLNPPQTNQPNPPLQGLNCNSVMILSGSSSANNLIPPPSQQAPFFLYPFNITLPPEAEGLPVSLEINVLSGPTCAFQINTLLVSNLGNPGNLLTPDIFNPNLYYFNLNGSSQLIPLNGLDVLLPIAMGCNCGPRTIEFKLNVFCNSNNIGTQSPCLGCNQTRTYERSIGTLSNTNISNAFSQSGCDLTWTLQLTNPATDPTLDLANLTLEVTTGMIIQGTPTISFSNGSPTGLIPPTFTLNSNVANTVTSTLSLQNFQLTPGGSVTYTINFHLTEDLCSLVPLNNLLSASFSGDNVCNEPLGPIPININTATPNLANLLTGLVANPTCCEQDPTITVNHVCSATATNGSILVTNPNLGGTLPIVATLYNPFPCVTPACSTMVVSSISLPNPTFVGLGIGTYYLTIWDPNNGGYYTQTVLIEDHSFTLTIEPTTPAFCDPGNVLLTAIPTPNTPPLSSFNFTYAWYSNNIPILNANGSTYLANSAGSYTVIVTDGGNCTASATTNVVVNPPLSINGPPTACDINAQYYLPAVIPTNGTFQYTWKINNVLHQSTSNNFTTIDWSTYGYFGGVITVSIPDGACGEKQILTFNVQPCCDSPNMPKLYVDNLSDIFTNTPLNTNVALTNPGEYTISNATFELENLTNQFLFCDANLILDNCNIAMNDANSFKMSNGKNITLINTNIKGCLTRHNGIDATAGNNFVRIDNSTNQSGIIQDANTAININRGNLTSINGGFDKNIEHIYAEKSTVNIIGGYYNCSGNLLPPFNPVLLPPNNSISFSPTATSFPRWGIRLFNCNPNSISNGGGSLPVIKEVIIINANTGIEVRGGGLICKGNTISNCTRGIYHWNTINSSQNADAECNIGTWNGTTSDANQFTNCAESIFAGGKLIPCHIDGNYVFDASSFGIKLQWVKGREFTMNENKLTNCQTGIYSYGNFTNGGFLGSNIIKTISRNELQNDRLNVNLSKAIVIEEASISTVNQACYIHVSSNLIQDYRHGIIATNCAFARIIENKIYLNSDLAGIWNQAGNLTDYINGVGINYCPKAIIKDNKVSSTETTPYAWANWLTSGFRIDMSPGTTVCSNLASETGPYPNTSVNASMQIGDPFEFHGNCAPSTFKLNTMNNSTVRGLYMGGMPIGVGGTNGVIIGNQFDAQLISPWVFSFSTRDNYWTNVLNGFHTDYNNVDGTLNEFWMTYSTSGFNNNSLSNIGGINNPNYSFQSLTLPNNPTTPCSNPFLNPVVDPINLNSYDDIARDSILALGGNDTSRYFGKEFLYAQMMADSTLYSYAVLAQFKDSIESTNVKSTHTIKNKLVYPIDSAAVDTLNTLVSSITPNNNIESNYKEVFALALKNPELKDSVYLPADMEQLRYIAHMCPYTDGSAVFTARVILHAFEPDSNYYNYCEFAKRPDRETSERFAQEQENIKQQNNISKISGYKLIPNPNNGLFSLFCSEDLAITLKVYDSKGRNVFEQFASPNQGVLNINLTHFSNGIYNMVITNEKNNVNLRFIILK
jgi:hypothetical protein